MFGWLHQHWQRIRQGGHQRHQRQRHQRQRAGTSQDVRQEITKRDAELAEQDARIREQMARGYEQQGMPHRAEQERDEARKKTREAELLRALFAVNLNGDQSQGANENSE